MFFVAGGRLYTTDGTPAGTVQVAPTLDASAASGFKVWHGALYFFANGTFYRSDGTAAGTVPVVSAADVRPASGATLVENAGGLYFFATNADGSFGLYRTDGTAGGTARLVTLSPTGQANSVPPRHLLVLNGRFVFKGWGNNDLWASDGTAAGTAAFTTTYYDDWLYPSGFDGLAYFQASGSGFTTGIELWRTDGTLDGTMPVADLNPGPRDSYPAAFAVVDGRLLFGATQDPIGNELWTIEAATVTAPAAPGGLTATAVTGGRVELTWADLSDTEAAFRLDRSLTPDFASIDRSVEVHADSTRYADTTVAPATAYYYRLVASNRGGASAATSAFVSVPAVPAAPSALRTSGVTDRRVSLAWGDNAAGETGYRVERSRHQDFRTIDLAATLPADATSYDDTTVQPSARYYYRVAALGAGGRSAEAVVAAATLAAAPGSFDGVGLSGRSVEVRWADTSGTAGSFVIERAPVGGAFVTLATVPSAQSSYIDALLPANSTWVYRLSVQTATGTTTWGTVTLTTKAPELTSSLGFQPRLDHAPSSYPSAVVRSGAYGYFTAYTPATGREIWRTDGTADGTALLKNLDGGQSDSNVTWLTDAGGTLYFVASAPYPSIGGPILWKSDGTAAGTVPVKDTNPGGNAFVHDLIPFDGRLFFRGVGTGDSDSLWATDGTAAGTVEVGHFGWRNGGANYRWMAVAGGRLILGANTPDGDNLPVLYVSDGTPGGTVRLATASGYVVTESTTPVTVGGLVYFLASPPAGGQATWWRTDGTPAGTFAVANAPGVGQNAEARAVGDTLYVPMFDPAVGWELFKIGPGDVAATLVKAAAPGSASATAHALAGVGGDRLIFVASAAGTETLWASDGSAAGTQPLRTFAAPAGPAAIGAVRVGDAAYFFVRDPNDGWELWRTDGTAAGTRVVSGFAAAVTAPTALAARGGLLTFTIDDGANGSEPWQSDGTTAGTRLICDVSNTALLPRPDSMTTVGGRTFFTVSPITGGYGPLWVTDGTPGGTALLRDADCAHLLAVGNVLYFTSADPSAGLELWASDGTVAGTRRVVDVEPGPGTLNPLPLADVAGSLFFGTRESTGNYTLWRTDGTEAGTTQLSVGSVVRVDAGAGVSLAVLGGKLVFTGFDGRPWASDGTPGGTGAIASPPNPSTAPALGYAVLGGRAYFSAGDPAGGHALWSTDGTAGGTALVRHAEEGTNGAAAIAGLTAANGALYFAAADPGNGVALWRSDGTAGGTSVVAAGIVFSPRAFTAVGGQVFFIAARAAGATALYLWRTDGTTAGTAAIRAIDVSPAQGRKTYLVNVNGTLFYTDFHSLYRSDGTYQGTYEVMTIDNAQHDTEPLNPPLAAALGDRLVFSAVGNGGGRELRFASVTPPAAPTGLTVVAPVAGSPGPVAAAAAAAAGPQGTVLTWTAHSADAAGYAVERSTTADFATVDATFFAPAGADSVTDASAAVGVRYFYRVRAVNAGGASAYSNRVTTGAPGVFQFAADDRTAAQRFEFRFSADVSASLGVANLTLTNLATGATVPAAASDVAYDRADNTATFTFAPGAIPDGRYRLTLRAAGVVAAASGLALDGDGDGVAGGDFGSSYSCIGGDANRDAAVDFNDLVPLAQHYNMAGGMTWADGDFTGDGNVDFNDLVKLAQNYNTSLAGAPATGPALSFDAAMAAAFASVATPVISAPPPFKPQPPVVTQTVAKPKPPVVVKPPAVTKPPAPVPKPVKPVPKPMVKAPAKPAAKAVTAVAKVSVGTLPPPAPTFGTMRIKDAKKTEPVW